MTRKLGAWMLSGFIVGIGLDFANPDMSFIKFMLIAGGIWLGVCLADLIVGK